MRFSTFVLKNVFRRRTRSTLTLTGMAIAVGAVVALVGIAYGFSSSLLESYEGRDVALIVARSDSINPMVGTIPEKLGTDIAALDGVEAVCPGLVDVLSFENLGVQNILTQGWPEWAYMFQNLTIVKGQCLSKEFKGKRGIMLGKKLADNTNLKVGDEVTMCEEHYKVVGIFESFVSMENSMAVLLLEDAQELMGKSGKITGCTVKVKDPTNQDKLDEIREAIEGPLAAQFKLKGKLQATPPQDYVKDNKQIRAGKAMAWMTSAIALFIGAIGMLNTMVMSVFERTREIGILRAIGWRPSRIMRMILMESILLSIGGGIVGTILGIGLTWGLSQVPAVNGMISGKIAPHIVVLGFVIAILVGLIGAAYPAYRGSRLLPTEALRHE